MTLLVPNLTGIPAARQQQATPHRFTLEEYHRISELGVFQDRRVELIDGEILDVPPQKDLHAYCVTRASKWCNKVFDDRSFWVRVQMTLESADSSPEPDVVVLAGPPSPKDSYASANDAVLVIEVADSTLLGDLGTKAGVYARAGVKEYWVVDIPDRALVVHRQPVRSAGTKQGWAYGDVKRLAPTECVSPIAMPTASADPAQFLP